MIDLTKITPEQANKIECALIMLQGAVAESIKVHRRLSEEKDLSEKVRATMKSNAEWWQEVHDLLYGKECEE